MGRGQVRRRSEAGGAADCGRHPHPLDEHVDSRPLVWVRDGRAALVGEANHVGEARAASWDHSLGDGTTQCVNRVLVPQLLVSHLRRRGTRTSRGRGWRVEPRDAVGAQPRTRPTPGEANTGRGQPRGWSTPGVVNLGRGQPRARPTPGEVNPGRGQPRGWSTSGEANPGREQHWRDQPLARPTHGLVYLGRGQPRARPTWGEANLGRGQHRGW